MFYRSILKELENWRVSPFRKPLIIRGARQVGKTTVVNTFGQQFEQYIYLNLEKKSDRDLFDENLDINEIVDRIFLIKGMKRSLIQNTLLFIDEIQEAGFVVNLLRYFKEEVSELPVIAAGSMLETLLGKNITFPVGRVEFKVLRPFSFVEFLNAIGREDILEQLNTVPLKSFALDACLKLFHKYALVGGMPEVLKKYIETKDITGLGDVFDGLLNSYLTDAEKYAKSQNQLQLIRYCIHQVIPNAGKRITFSKFGNSTYSSNDISQVLNALQKTHLIHLLYPVIGFDLPLEQDFKKSPKLQFLDSGIINYFVGLQKDIIGTRDLNTIYEGKLIEHLVGQELLSMQTLSLQSIYFWTREKNQSQAEIDFVYPFESEVVPIEVKSGPTGKLKSLHLYMENTKVNYAIRFYAGKIQLDTLYTKEGKRFYLLNLPYFLVSKIEEYIQWLKNQIETLNSSSSFQEPVAVYQRLKPKRPKEQLVSSLYELTDKHKEILRFCMEKPKKGKEIIEGLLDLSYQTRNKTIYLKPLLDLGLLSFTDLNYLKSKQQKYQTTKTGIELITERQLSLF